MSMSFDGASGTRAWGVVKVTIDDEFCVRFIFNKSINMFTKETSFVNADEFLVFGGHWAFRFEMNTKEVNEMAADLDFDMEDSSAHCFFFTLELVDEGFFGWRVAF